VARADPGALADVGDAGPAQPLLRDHLDGGAHERLAPFVLGRATAGFHGGSMPEVSMIVGGSWRSGR
jgi:hypothetical protein